MTGIARYIEQATVHSSMVRVCVWGWGRGLFCVSAYQLLLLKVCFKCIVEGLSKMGVSKSLCLTTACGQGQKRRTGNEQMIGMSFYPATVLWLQCCRFCLSFQIWLISVLFVELEWNVGGRPWVCYHALHMEELLTCNPTGNNLRDFTWTFTFCKLNSVVWTIKIKITFLS